MPAVKMNSIQSVEIDGVDVGSLASADKLLTFEEIQAAVVEWHDRERVAMQATFNETINDKLTEHLEVVGKLQKQIDALNAAAVEKDQVLSTATKEAARWKRTFADHMNATEAGQASFDDVKLLVIETQMALLSNEKKKIRDKREGAE